MEPFTWKKIFLLPKQSSPHTESASVARGWILFPCLQCLQAQAVPLKYLRLALFHFCLKGEGSQSKVPIKDLSISMCCWGLYLKRWDWSILDLNLGISLVQLWDTVLEYSCREQTKRYKIHKPPNASLLMHKVEIRWMRLIFKVLERTLKSLQGFSFKKSFLIVQVLKCIVLLVCIF